MKSKDPKDVLEEIRESNEDIYEQYKHLTISFEDFISESGPLFKRSVEESDNDTIGKAVVFMDDQNKNKILESLPQTRREIVDAIILSNKNTLTKSESEENQKTILDHYRKFKKDFI